MLQYSRRVILGSLGALGAGLTLAACSSPSTSSSTAAATAAAGTATAKATAYTLHSDLAYAAKVGRAHLLDLYIPKTGSGPFKVVILQTGSAFLSDDTKTGLPTMATGGGMPTGAAGAGMPTDIPKGAFPTGAAGAGMPTSAAGGGASAADPTGLGGMTTAASLADMWASEGYAIVGLNVRSSSQAQFPAQVYDIKAAIRYLRANASKYNLDSDRFATMGTSSGSWVTMMGGLTSGVASLEGDLGNADQPTDIQAVIDLFGPTDFLQMDAHIIKGGDKHNPASSPESTLMGFPIQSKPKETEKANPAAYVTKSSPPIYISHGLKDTIVPSYESVLLFDAYEKAKATASLTLVPGVTHTDSYLAEASDSAGRTVKKTVDGTTTTGTTPAPTYDTLLAFLNTHLA